MSVKWQLQLGNKMLLIRKDCKGNEGTEREGTFSLYVIQFFKPKKLIKSSLSF